MLEHDNASSSLRRIALRAALVVVPLAGLALAAPKLVSLMKNPTAGLAGPGPEGTSGRPADRPATEEEIEAARTAEQKLAEAEKTWRKSAAIAPSEAAADDSGEKVRWFQGFGLSIESTPEGAQVLVDGKDMGRTPVVTSVACDAGDDVRVELRHPPLRAQRRTTKCRKDQLVELRFELK